MGKNAIRQLSNQLGKWTDKSAPKHKHNFIVPINVKLIQGCDKNRITYYHVMKCEYCNSFVSVPKQGAMNGFIKEPIDNLPIMELHRSHKDMGFNGAVFIDKEN